MKKNTYITGPNSQYRFGKPLVEIAKFLETQARRFRQDKANVNEVNEAILLWQEELKKQEK